MEIICDPSGIYDQPEQSTLSRPEQWLTECLTRESDSGMPVSWKTAMGLSAAWYCLNTISNDVGQLHCDLFTVIGSNREEDKKHPGGKIMRQPMKGGVDAFHFRQTLQLHSDLHGNGRAYIIRNGREEPDEFLILDPERTGTFTVQNTELGSREKWHVVFPDSGEPIAIPDYDCLHIFGSSHNGYYGISPLEILRNKFGLSSSMEKTANRFFKNAAVPSLILEAPAGVFTKESDAQEFLRNFNDRHAGQDNAGRAGLLRQGITAKPLTMPLRDAQMLEQREFEVRELMRVFGMPMIPGVSDSQSYNTLEQLNRAYLLHCLGPRLKAWQVECGNKLLTEKEKRLESHYFEFNTWNLVKPDASAEADMLVKLKNGKIITSNEGREVLSYPPHPDGDELENAATSTNATAAATEPAAEPIETEPTTNRERQLIASKLRPLIAAEIARVNEMSGKARNFLDWSEAFYAKHETRLAASVVALGGEAWIAAEYIEHSKSQILEVAGASHAEALPANLKTETADWLERANQLADLIAN